MSKKTNVNVFLKMAARLSISLTFDTCHTTNVYLKYSFYNHNVHVLLNEFERYFSAMIDQDIDPDVRSKNFEKKTQRKVKRLQYLISNDAGVVCSNDPTKVRKTINYYLHT